MNCTKTLNLTGYEVTFVDSREPAPRTVRREVCVMDRDFIEALKLVNIGVDDYIRQRYASHGYRVGRTERVQGKRLARVDLLALWSESAPAAADPDQQPATTEAQGEQEAQHE